MQACCGGVLSEKYPGVKCCGTQSYVPRRDNKICCNGVLHPTSTGNICCGTHAYRKYSSSNPQMCCGGELKPKNSGFQCCGNQFYQPSFQTCCAGKRVHKSYEKGLCCGEWFYHSDRYFCCKRTFGADPFYWRLNNGFACCDGGYLCTTEQEAQELQQNSK